VHSGSLFGVSTLTVGEVITLPYYRRLADMELVGHLRNVSKSLTKLEKAHAEWNFGAFEKSSRAFRQGMHQVGEEWERSLSEIERDLSEKSQFIDTVAYKEQLERSLQAAGLPIKGEYPRYELPPFKLEIDIKGRRIRLIFGRRAETTSSFLPEVVVRWVGARYKRVVESPFDAERFGSDLLAAYEVANRLTYRTEKVLWGRAVSLMELYSLLTLRHGTRKEYSKNVFTYDLTRLRQGPLLFDGRRYEFGYSREVGRTLLLRDQSGREERLSSLTIYDRGS